MLLPLHRGPRDVDVDGDAVRGDGFAVLLPVAPRRDARRRLAMIGAAVVVVSALAALWTWTPLASWIRPDRLARIMSPYAHQPWAALLTGVGFIALGLLAVPVNVLIFATGLAFGPVLGLVYSTWGFLCSAVGLYGIGLALGQRAANGDGVVQRAVERLERSGLVGIIVLRALPIAPYSLVNLLAGAGRIGFRRYILGTIVGMLPGTAVMTLFSGGLRNQLVHPTRTGWVAVAAAGALIVTVTLVLRRALSAASAQS